MKKTLLCPKCSGKKIWHVPTTRITGTELLFRFELFVCHGCGYTEWYAFDATNNLQGEGLKTRLLGDDEPPESPFR